MEGNACCGKTAYNRKKNGCCESVITVDNDCCGISLNSTDQVCCNGEIQDGHSCCGLIGYDKRKSVCCKGVVREGNDCCGKKINMIILIFNQKKMNCYFFKGFVGFDRNSHVCCDFNINKGNECCG